MRKSFIILLAFLLLLGLSLPALATADSQTPAPLMNEDGSIAAAENPNMFLSYAGGIALFAIIILSVWLKVRAMQNGAGGRR